jgi:predicted DNA-binding transcriptional regulator AlpA
MDQCVARTVKLLRMPEVCAKTSKSPSSIYSDIGSGRFPKPIKIGRRTSAWIESELDTWIEERALLRDRRVRP